MSELLSSVLAILGIIAGYVALQRHINREVSRQVRETAMLIIINLREIDPPEAFKAYRDKAFVVIDDIVNPKR